MSREELISAIDRELYNNVLGEKPRDQATGRKGYSVMSDNLGTAIFEYLDGTYWQRIVDYVESRVLPIENRIAQIENKLNMFETQIIQTQHIVESVRESTQLALDTANAAKQTAELSAIEAHQANIIASDTTTTTTIAP